MAPRVAFVSFRFGPTDGVSVVARTWRDCLEDLGFDTVTVTAPSDGDADEPDRGVRGLDLGSPPEGPVTTPRERDRLRTELVAALADVDLVVAENVLTIPLNLTASRELAAVLAGRPAVVHHHDPPWHRSRFAGITELPATDPAWRHVAINTILASELAGRGIDATVVYNAFPAPRRRTGAEREGLRSAVRGAIGVGDDEVVVAHPVRAIERKNIPAAVSLCEELGATYWLLGPAEEGYGGELDRIRSGARCRWVHHRWPDPDGIYAAADLVAFPSTWEGFGNPPIEAALHRVPAAVGRYPVAAELRSLGFDWFAPEDTDGIAAAVRDPDDPANVARLDHNEAIATRDFSLDRLRADLTALLDEAGWRA